jgi:hypothetical protein
MKTRFKFFLGVTLIALLSTSIYSCKDDEVVQLANLDVKIVFADGFTGLTAEGINVSITNTVDNGVETVLTDADGLASFVDIAPGTYNVSASLELTAEEAGVASGYYEEMTLNAVENNVNLLGGVDSDITITLDGKASSSLVIKEFYYNGANDPTWSVLFKDQFVEIFNNSSEVVYADGLYLASLAPTANGSSANDVRLA